MLRALALLLALLLAGAAARAEAPIDRAASLLAEAGPLVCRPGSPIAAAGAPCGDQLAAASCSQTCFDDQNACRAGCDKAYGGGTSDRDKCVAGCSTTYGRCNMRCNAR